MRRLHRRWSLPLAVLFVGAVLVPAGAASRAGATPTPAPACDPIDGGQCLMPFPDNVEVAAQAGCTAIIQPGGSVRDDEVIAAANEHGLAMVFTAVRHFKH